MSCRRGRRLLLVCAVLSILVVVSIEADQPDNEWPDAIPTNEIEEEQNSDGDRIGLPCGIGHRPLTSLSGRVVGGNEAEPGEYPWMVNMKYKNGFHFCGGVIIDKRHILTARHCLNPTTSTIEELMSYKLVIGDYDQARVDGERTVDIERVMYKNLTSNALPDDLALVRTRRAIKFRLTKDRLGSVNRICLPRGDNFKVQYNRRVTVAGWGWGSIGGEAIQSATKLREVDVSIKRCIDQGDEVSRYTLCATANNGKDACRGDSGGPLFSRSATTGQFVLAGIVQAGPKMPCGGGYRDGIYANVHSHLEWMDEYL